MSKTEVLINKKYITKDWAEVLEKPLTYFYDVIVPKLKESKVQIYPEGKSIFRALNECPYKDIKVVILGQDPYFDGSATGLAFDNRYAKKKGASQSLKRIIKEISSDIYNTDVHGYSTLKPIEHMNDNSVLQHLPKQGILLLNTALTVEHKNPSSHIEIWKPFTDSLIAELQKKDNIVWILWGNHAKSFKDQITNKTHKIVEGCHPAARGKHNKFAGGKYFSKTNTLLEKMGHIKISW